MKTNTTTFYNIVKFGSTNTFNQSILEPSIGLKYFLQQTSNDAI